MCACLHNIVMIIIFSVAPVAIVEDSEKKIIVLPRGRNLTLICKVLAIRMSHPLSFQFSSCLKTAILCTT